MLGEALAGAALTLRAAAERHHAAHCLHLRGRRRCAMRAGQQSQLAHRQPRKRQGISG